MSNGRVVKSSLGDEVVHDGGLVAAQPVVGVDSFDPVLGVGEGTARRGRWGRRGRRSRHGRHRTAGALMLGAAVGARQETHFRFALGAAAAGPLRGPLEAFGRLATAAIGVVLAVWGTSLMIATWALKTPGAPLPTGLNFLPFVVGGALMALFAIERLRGGRGG